MNESNPKQPGNDKPAERNGKPGKKGGDALVLALAMGDSIPQAAKKAGLGVTTAYRRMADPAFRRAVSLARDDLLGQVVGRLLGVACKAVDTLEANLDSENEGVRNRAAIAVLANMIRGMDSVELARRLTEVEERP